MSIVYSLYRLIFDKFIYPFEIVIQSDIGFLKDVQI